MDNRESYRDQDAKNSQSSSHKAGAGSLSAEGERLTSLIHVIPHNYNDSCYGGFSPRICNQKHLFNNQKTTNITFHCRLKCLFAKKSWACFTKCE